MGEEVEAPEAALVSRVRAGEPRAFDELVRLHLGRVFGIVLRVLGQREDAEDVTQEVFLAVLEKIDTYDSRRPFEPWLYRIAMNRALNAK
ncbi:MAG TPA: sigma-70 family RNA polymerase sigma factor, partial [Candidatus Eisenbacteria bacterium]|nr:sigma-70 family RNA polymerase sigma factor [Candidatus Eisenbacteria bacterium]